MKVGIIVYSQTGNTLSVAERLKEKLNNEKIKVDIERIELEDRTLPRIEPFKIIKSPDISKYDVLIFGSLVEGFSLSPVMKKYIEGLTSLKNKKVFSYVTHYFPFAFLGGKSSISQIKKLINNKEEEVIDSGIINWKNKKREEEINELVERFVQKIKQC